ncbi:helix-turn-helix domain-containing protein [Lutispora sp.]|uniref:helix-turn-helix domain-containing protein n=1 Tax=Lutispora sp. TaxID=2828727 RepID=UPI002B2153A4|nr:helix-turn-helix domain-containing protein [Lutispora sp.]MEA4960712.1 helix-turn-helix domain-containing protein [Lutispora sp.]
MSIIGTNIRNTRNKKNLSLKELAKKSGVTEQYLADIESGKKIPNQKLIESISKALGISVDLLEPSYFSQYFEDDDEKNEPKNLKHKITDRKPSEDDNAISSALSKAVRKIPVIDKITSVKDFPNKNDIVDYKYEPVFQNKAANVPDGEFVYYIAQDNAMANSRILKGDLALVFITDSIRNGDIILYMEKNKCYIRRIAFLDKEDILLYADNHEYQPILSNQKNINIIGKVVRVEFKI